MWSSDLKKKSDMIVKGRLFMGGTSWRGKEVRIVMG
jgi:hypothetical protein